MKTELEKRRRGIKMPHVYILLILVMALVVVLSWVVPSGEFARVQDPNTGQMVVDPNNFSYVEKTNPISLLDFFTAIHIGIVQSGDIIVMLLLAVGSIYLVEKSGAIAAGIHKLLEISQGKELLLICILTLVFTIMGAIGFGEGGLPFIPLAVSIVTAMGYDKITGMATAMAGMAIGFSSGVLNLYTTGIAQSIVGLPLYSGIGYRIVALAVFYVITMMYIVGYARKTKTDPSKSVVANNYMEQLNQSSQEVKQEKVEFTLQRKLALISLLAVFILQAFGAIKLKWGLPQMSALYLILAFILVLIFKWNPSEACVDFAYGASRLLPAALAIGLARSVMVLMTQVKIIDTAIYELAAILDGKGPFATLLLIYISVIIFNFFVISGSGKAVILMPILGPLGQLLNINQQVMVLVYNFGDGLTNYLWPTSGALMAGLSMCDIEWQEWAKFSAKLFIILSTVAFGMVLLGHYINLGPF